MMLVDLIDHLLAILDNDPRYRCYHLDGQSVILEDYLTLRPEMAEVIGKHIREGRILAGPWYSLPDMNAIGGECIIRNLLVGHRTVARFGSPMKVGYTPTGFGHVSQLPQIYNGFGIDTALFYRGADRQSLKKEFLWESPQGSRVVAYLFTPEFGRMPLYHCVTRRVLYDREFYEREHQWDEGEGPFRWDNPHTRWNLYYQSSSKESFNRERIAAETRRMIETELAHSQLDTFLVIDGTDSSEPEPSTPSILAAMNDACDTHEFVHSTLPEFAEILRTRQEGLSVARGEMRSSAKDGVQVNLFGDTLSNRTDLKILNAQAERQLLGWAEPLACFAWLAGNEYPAALLAETWKTLLNNQAHDCIAGSGQDIVHEDMQYHYRQVLEASDEVTRRSLFHLVSSIDCERYHPQDLLFTVINSRPFSRSGVVRMRLDVPAAWDSNGLIIEDADGNPVPFQVDSRTAGEKVLIHRPKDAPGWYNATSWWILFRAEDIPACGWSVYRVAPKQNGSPPRLSRKMEDPRAEIENDLFRIEVNPRGTFDLTDKRSGKTFTGLGLYEDRGEIGDAYFSIPVPEDETLYGPDGHPRVEVEQSPLLSRIAVTFDFAVPSTSSKEGRAPDTVALPIKTEIVLEQGTPWVAIRTEVDNTARDHRLRVRFPTGLGKATESVSDMPFDHIRRPIAPRDTDGWFERGYPNHPLRTFCAVATEDEGFALAVKGLPEFEVYQDEEKTLALTLLRGSRVRIPKIKTADPAQEGTQQLGPQVFEYAVLPFTGWKDLESVHREALNYSHPFHVCQFGKQAGTLPTRYSHLEVAPPFELSAVKRSERGESLVVRVWNTSKAPAKGTLTFGFSVEKAWLVDLQEVRLELVGTGKANVLEFHSEPHEILSFEVVPQADGSD
jgi:hypothetical protein